MEDNAADDALLWRRAREGGDAAFGLIFDRHRDGVFRHAYALLRDRNDAEDASAVAFLELWRRRRSVRVVDGSVLPWLLVTTTLGCRNLDRSRRRYRRLLERLPHEVPDAPIDDPTRLDARRALVPVPRELTPDDAALLSLVAIEGYPIADAARVLGVSADAARTRWHRLRARLRRDLTDHQPEPANGKEESWTNRR